MSSLPVEDNYERSEDVMAMTMKNDVFWEPYNVTSRKTAFFIVAAVKTSNLTD
jgi:hypothetical protein